MRKEGEAMIDCRAKLELAAWRFCAEGGLTAREGREAIVVAMENGMTWPIGCLGMPAGYVVGSSSARTATSGEERKNSRRIKADKAASTTGATGAEAGTGENAELRREPLIEEFAR